MDWRRKAPIPALSRCFFVACYLEVDVKVDVDVDVDVGVDDVERSALGVTAAVGMVAGATVVADL